MVEHAHLLQPEQQVIDAARQARDEERLKVGEGAPTINLPGEGDRWDEKAVMKVVGR